MVVTRNPLRERKGKTHPLFFYGKWTPVATRRPPGKVSPLRRDKDQTHPIRKTAASTHVPLTAMNRYLAHCVFTKVFPLFSLILLHSAAAAFAQTAAEEAFLAAVRAAVGSGDDKALWGLFHLNGVEEDMKKPIEKYVIKRMRRAKVLDVKIEPLPEDYRAEQVVNGVRYYPNIKPLARVTISYEKEEGGDHSTSIAYGKTGGQLLFIGTLKEKLAGNLPPSKQIQVIIIGRGHPAVTFEGYMIYLQGGKPIRKTIEDMGGGNVTHIVRGEAITYLEVRRTSAAGTIKVLIYEDEDTVFETEALETAAPIVFSKH